MRRLAAIAVALLIVLAAGAALRDAGARGSSNYRVDAIFDTAKGIIPGQLVKIAGARVGTVQDVTLTPDFKARIQMQVDRRFAPFRSDAACSIQPEGLLAENFVQCDPGTPRGSTLTATGSQAATVPVGRNSVPVNLNDLFNIANVPTRERLTVLINELGIGLAGRGQDLNALLRRANPTLGLARRAIAILNGQRHQLATIVDATDRVGGDLARRRARVQDFIVQAAGVTSQTTSHRRALAESIRRLPALLDATQPALRRLDELTISGAPVLSDLRASAPGVNRLLGDVRPFATAALPTVRHLAPALRTGRRTVVRARPVVALLRTFARAALPTGAMLDQLLVSLRDRGFVEGLLSFVYYGTAATARYDSYSHLLPAHLLATECSAYASSPVAGCGTHFGSTAAANRVRGRHGRGSLAPAPHSGPAPAATAPGHPPAAAPPGAKVPAAPPAAAQQLVQQLVQSIARPSGTGGSTDKSLLDYLLK